MTEWWTFRPEDFLLFSPRVYWRLFELHNTALWPLPLLMPAMGLLLLVLALRHRINGRLLFLALAALWVFVGWSFVWSRYATINWAALYVAPLFGLQALFLLLAAGGTAGPVRDRGGIVRFVGVGLSGFAIVGYPLLAPLLGRSWSSAEIFGLAPDPTAIGTLSFLLLTRGRLISWLMLIPALWCLLSMATLWTMAVPGFWVPVAAAAIALAGSAQPAVVCLRPAR